MTENDILNLENQLYEAMKSGNLQRLDELLHHELLFIVPGGETITKEMDLETYRSGNLKLTELVPDMEQLRILDDLAIVVVRLNLKGTYNGEPFEARYRYIRFWKKFSNGVKVVGGSGVAI